MKGESNGTSDAGRTNGTNGTNGIHGANGNSSANGTNGTNSVDGSNGTNGVHVANGTNGTNGAANGANGAHSTNGINGANGTNGVDGVNGTNGANGTNGTNGTNGVHHGTENNGKDETSHDPRLFVFSARTEKSLTSYLSDFDEYLEEAPESEKFTNNLSYTLGQRRTQFPYRFSAVAGSAEALQEKLSSAKPNRAKDQAIAFAFTGQGAQ